MNGARAGDRAPEATSPGGYFFGSHRCDWSRPRRPSVYREPGLVAPLPARLPAAPERALVDTAGVPAGHIAGRTLPERMDARRDDVANSNNGNKNDNYHAWHSLLTHARTARSPVPPYTRAGYRDSDES